MEETDPEIEALKELELIEFNELGLEEFLLKKYIRPNRRKWKTNTSKSKSV